MFSPELSAVLTCQPPDAGITAQATTAGSSELAHVSSVSLSYTEEIQKQVRWGQSGAPEMGFTCLQIPRKQKSTMDFISRQASKKNHGTIAHQLKEQNKPRDEADNSFLCLIKHCIYLFNHFLAPTLASNLMHKDDPSSAGTMGAHHYSQVIWYWGPNLASTPGRHSTNPTTSPAL